MRVRAIVHSEEAPIAEIWRRSWASANPHVTTLEPPEHWLARVSSEFSNPSEVVVVETMGGIGAFIVFNVANAYVAQLFTEPSLQGQGFGRVLLTEAVHRMSQGWSLHVATTNHRAHLFYERFGLVRGEIDSNPVTGRERVAYSWQARNPLLVADTQRQEAASGRKPPFRLGFQFTVSRSVCRQVQHCSLVHLPTVFLFTKDISMDWAKEIVIAVLVKRKVAEADTAHVWDHAFPGVAATEQEIGDVEARLGFSLDAGNREFLLHANGWDWFFQSVDVFGTSDFLEGPRCQRAGELLKSLESLSDLCGFNRDELLPIAVSRFNTDVFAISTSRSHSPGTVFWFAGQVIDTFPSFGEWFLSMVDYNRDVYKCLVEEKL